MNAIDETRHNVIFEILEGSSNTLPAYGTEFSAGLDMSACLDRPVISSINRQNIIEHRSNENISEKFIRIFPGEVLRVSLGFKCQIPTGYCMKLYVRSSIGLRGICLSNSVGIIDSDYRGELFASLLSTKTCEQEYPEIRNYERIVQAVFTKIERFVPILNTVNVTERSEGGFGSTGRM